MNAEAQRIAIAEACGWKELYFEDTSVWGKAPLDLAYKGERGFAVIAYEVPNYHTDLNAMHEAEKTFENCEIKWHTYNHQLVRLLEAHRHVVHATAAQRAEAFLRTIGKWDDTK